MQSLILKWNFEESKWSVGNESKLITPSLNSVWDTSINITSTNYPVRKLKNTGIKRIDVPRAEFTVVEHHVHILFRVCAIQIKGSHSSSSRMKSVLPVTLEINSIDQSQLGKGWNEKPCAQQQNQMNQSQSKWSKIAFIDYCIYWFQNLTMRNKIFDFFLGEFFHPLVDVKASLVRCKVNPFCWSTKMILQW